MVLLHNTLYHVSRLICALLLIFFCRVLHGHLFLDPLSLSAPCVVASSRRTTAGTGCVWRASQKSIRWDLVTMTWFVVMRPWFVVMWPWFVAMWPWFAVVWNIFAVMWPWLGLLSCEMFLLSCDHGLLSCEMFLLSCDHGLLSCDLHGLLSCDILAISSRRYTHVHVCLHSATMASLSCDQSFHCHMTHSSGVGGVCGLWKQRGSRGSQTQETSYSRPLQLASSGWTCSGIHVQVNQ